MKGKIGIIKTLLEYEKASENQNSYMKRYQEKIIASV